MTTLRRAMWRGGTPARAVLIGLIRAYRLTLGQFLGGRCRFHPSCSAYAEVAIARTGALRGAGLAVWRVLRCSPLSKGGVDLPPAGVRPQYEAIIHATHLGRLHVASRGASR